MSRWPRAVAILRVAFAEAPKLRSCSEAVIWLGKQAGYRSAGDVFGDGLGSRHAARQDP